MGRLKRFVIAWIFCFCSLCDFSLGQEVNVAVGKPTDQLSGLNFANFTWTADRAVDNCTNATSPETSGCCSASQGTTDNYWLVDLEDQYMVTSIVIIGRDDGAGNQLTGFLVFIEETSGGTEEQVYDNTAVPYGNGTFVIPLANRLVSTVTVRRPTGNIITLCEVQVFAVGTTTSSPMETSVTSTDDVSMMTSMDPDMTQSPDTDMSTESSVTMDPSVTMVSSETMSSSTTTVTSTVDQGSAGSKGSTVAFGILTLAMVICSTIHTTSGMDHLIH